MTNVDVSNVVVSESKINSLTKTNNNKISIDIQKLIKGWSQRMIIWNRVIALKIIIQEAASHHMGFCKCDHGMNAGLLK